MLYVYCVHFQEMDLASGKTFPLMSDPSPSFLCKTQSNPVTLSVSVTYLHIAGPLSTLKPEREKGLRLLSQQFWDLEGDFPCSRTAHKLNILIPTSGLDWTRVYQVVCSLKLHWEDGTQRQGTSSRGTKG